MKKPKKRFLQLTDEYGEDNYLMYNININQKALQDNRWNLDIIDVAIFRAIEDLIQSGYLHTMKDENGLWYNVTEKRIVKRIPSINITDPSSIYRRVQKLIACNLIERNPNNSIGTKKWIRLGKDHFKMNNFKSNG